MQVRGVVEKIIKKALGVGEFADGVTSETTLEGLGLDSVGTLEVVVQLEEELGIEFPDESLNELTLRTLDSLVALVDEHRTK